MAACEGANWSPRCSCLDQLKSCALLHVAYNELMFSMSACEYDAPMIFLLCADVLEVLEVVRQKGEFELREPCQRLHTEGAREWASLRRAVCWQQNDMLATLDAMTPASLWKCTNRPGPFPARTACQQCIGSYDKLRSPAVASSSWLQCAHASTLGHHASEATPLPLPLVCPGARRHVPRGSCLQSASRAHQLLACPCLPRHLTLSSSFAFSQRRDLDAPRALTASNCCTTIACSRPFHLSTPTVANRSIRVTAAYSATASHSFHYT